MYEIISLINELLPPLPQGTICPLVSYGIQSKSSLGKHSLRSSTSKKEDTSGNVPDISTQETLFHDQPELLAQFGIYLFLVLVQVSVQSINPGDFWLDF